MKVLVLDAGAVSALAQHGTYTKRARGALESAARAGADVLIPAAVLAESYRTKRHTQAVDAVLGRERGMAIVPTDRTLARTVGHLLAKAGARSDLHVDACAVAVCQLAGGGVVLTGDGDDLRRLAQHAHDVHVDVLSSR